MPAKLKPAMAGFKWVYGFTYDEKVCHITQSVCDMTYFLSLLGNGVMRFIARLYAAFTFT